MTISATGESARKARIKKAGKQQLSDYEGNIEVKRYDFQRLEKM